MTNANMNEVDIVEHALRTWPMAQAPQGFSRQVLQRIETIQYPRVKFQFTWLDYALALFTVSGIFLALFVWNLLPAPLIMRLTYRMFLLLNAPQYQTVLVYSFLGIVGLLIFIVFTGVSLTRANSYNRELSASTN